MITKGALNTGILTNFGKSAPALFCGILLFYSASWVLSAVVVASAPPLWSVAIRLSASLAVVCVVNMLTGRFLPVAAIQPIAGRVIILSILGFALFFTATYMALRSLHPSQLVLVLSLIPGITYIIGIILLKHKPSSVSSIGIGISTAAVFMFAGPSLDQVSWQSGIGLGFAFLAAIGYASYGILYQRSLSKVSVFGALAYLLSISIVIVTLLAFIFEGAPTNIFLRDVTYLVFIGAILAAPVYVLYNLLISHHGALHASLISVAAPLLTIALETVVGLRPAIGMSELFIGLLGCAGVALVILDRSKRINK